MQRILSEKAQINEGSFILWTSSYGLFHRALGSVKKVMVKSAELII